jgi:hypothetical protein
MEIINAKAKKGKLQKGKVGKEGKQRKLEGNNKGRMVWGIRSVLGYFAKLKVERKEMEKLKYKMNVEKWRPFFVI